LRHDLGELLLGFLCLVDHDLLARDADSRLVESGPVRSHALAGGARSARERLRVAHGLARLSGGHARLELGGARNLAFRLSHGQRVRSLGELSMLLDERRVPERSVPRVARVLRRRGQERRVDVRRDLQRHEISAQRVDLLALGLGPGFDLVRSQLKEVRVRDIGGGRTPCRFGPEHLTAAVAVLLADVFENVSCAIEKGGAALDHPRTFR
jgi:hypothetical protein